MGVMGMGGDPAAALMAEISLSRETPKGYRKLEKAQEG